ncbi:MAG: hypothetical protein QMC80_07285 [Thermoplasmatales archaeon]|nr:hypothetical protein [Thermoplasmatales archaeon]
MRKKVRTAAMVILAVLLFVLSSVSLVGMNSPSQSGGAIRNVSPVLICISSVSEFENNITTMETWQGTLMDRNGFWDIQQINVTVYYPNSTVAVEMSWSNPMFLPASQPALSDNDIVVWKISPSTIGYLAGYTYPPNATTGTYRIIVSGNDEKDRAVFEDTTLVYTTHKISFKSGWNLVALPLQPKTRYTAELLMKEIEGATRIARWDKATQRYVSHIKALPINNFYIEPGEGYFVYVEKDSQFNLKGIIPPSLTINMAQGWNLVSIPVKYCAEEVCNLTGSTRVTMFNETTQFLVTHIKYFPTNNFIAEKDRGYFVKVENKCVWTPVM